MQIHNLLFDGLGNKLCRTQTVEYILHINAFPYGINTYIDADLTTYLIILGPYHFYDDHINYNIMLKIIYIKTTCVIFEKHKM